MPFVHLGLYLLLEDLGWRKGQIFSTGNSVIVKGSAKLLIPKSQLIRIEYDTNDVLSWYSYGIIEVTTKKYDLKIKCAEKDMDKMLRNIKKLFED